MCATGSGCVGETALDCNECKFAAHQLPDTSKTVCVAGCDASEYLDSSGICQSCDSECRLGCKVSLFFIIIFEVYININS